MKLLLLAGNSLRNNDWIHVVDENVSDIFDNTMVHHYAHWTNGNEFIDFDFESRELAIKTVSFEPYAIFA